MTEKPDQEFDPSKIPSFDPIQELKEKGQFHIKSDGTASMGKKETPAEKIEREERDALFLKAIKKMNMEREQELNNKDRY